MRTHYLNTRSRIKSFIVDPDNKPAGDAFSVSYTGEDGFTSDHYRLSGVLYNTEDLTANAFKYERVS